MKFKKEYLLALIPFLAIAKNKNLFQLAFKQTGTYKDVLKWRKIVEFYSSVYNIPVEIMLGIMATESMGINYQNKGKSGEYGLMQITPLGLQYVNTNYSIEQMKQPRKNIEVAALHLNKDYNLFNDWSYTIMSYNIDREHIQNVLNSTDGQNYTLNESISKVNGSGKTYLAKVKRHKERITPIYLNPEINDPNSDNFIPFESL